MEEVSDRLFLDILIDENLKKDFKMMCIDKDIDMKKRVLELIEKDVVNYLNE